MFNTRKWTVEGALVVLLLVGAMVTQGNTDIFDRVYGGFVENLRGPGADTFFELITNLGNWPFISIVCILLLAFEKTRKTMGVPVAITAIVSYVINYGIKVLIKRPRPELAAMIAVDGYSFPSGHAAVSMGVAAMIAYMFYKTNDKKIKTIPAAVVIVIIAFFVGISRIYLGVHYASDVFAGWAVGLGVYALISLFYYPHKEIKEKQIEKLMEKQRKKVEKAEKLEVEIVTEEQYENELKGEVVSSRKEGDL